MEDLKIIPFNLVGQSTWNDLANKLDPETSVIGNNWRILAEKLGFSTEQILNINARQVAHGRNTLKLFEDYIKRNGNSVGAVREALVEMERPDAVDALDTHLPEIREKYRKHKKMDSQGRIAVQHSYYAQSNHYESLGFSNYGMPSPPPAHCQSVNYSLNYHGKNSPVSSAWHYNDLSRNGSTSHSHSCSGNSTNLNVMATSYCNGHENSVDHYHNRLERPPENLSKIVHVDPRENYTSEEMDISDSCNHQEEGQPIAAAIQREQHYRNIAKKPCLTHTDAQDAEGINEMEDDNPHAHHRGHNLRLNIQGHLLRGNSMISPSPSPASGVGTPLPLAQLDQFTNSDSYMPSKRYAALIDDKNQLECEQERRAHNKAPNFKVPLPSNQKYNGDRILDFHVNSRTQSGGHLRQLPKTFPLRNKEAVYQSLPTKERPSILKSSISVPNDMKPAEYRKAFKHIKVFVTYAGDSKRHIQRVLNLCRCLEKNGFTCCMDMFDKRMDIPNRQEWCAQRFQEADFILMCVSNQYQMEWKAYECDLNVDDKELHIQFIYSLMVTEYKHNGGSNSRVIPLLFEGSTVDQIPTWLQGSFTYEWPKQYRDLLWCLTKPHTRIKPRGHYNQGSPTSPVNGQCNSL